MLNRKDKEVNKKEEYKHAKKQGSYKKQMKASDNVNKYTNNLYRPSAENYISPQTIERVTSYKLLGIHIHFPFLVHIDHIIKKATTRLYFLKQLKRSGLSNTYFCITVIRPALEFCSTLIETMYLSCTIFETLSLISNNLKTACDSDHAHSRDR